MRGRFKIQLRTPAERSDDDPHPGKIVGFNTFCRRNGMANSVAKLCRCSKTPHQKATGELGSRLMRNPNSPFKSWPSVRVALSVSGLFSDFSSRSRPSFQPLSRCRWLPLSGIASPLAGPENLFCVPAPTSQSFRMPQRDAPLKANAVPRPAFATPGSGTMTEWTTRIHP